MRAGVEGILALIFRATIKIKALGDRDQGNNLYIWLVLSSTAPWRCQRTSVSVPTAQMLCSREVSAHFLLRATQAGRLPRRLRGMGFPPCCFWGGPGSCWNRGRGTCSTSWPRTLAPSRTSFSSAFQLSIRRTGPRPHAPYRGSKTFPTPSDAPAPLQAGLVPDRGATNTSKLLRLAERASAPGHSGEPVRSGRRLGARSSRGDPLRVPATPTRTGGHLWLSAPR